MDVPEYPKEIFVGITDKCNISCIMCWRHTQHTPFLDMDKSILEKLKPAFEHADHIGWWSGGEIFAYTNIDELIILMQQLPDVKHSFSTNGKELANYAERLVSINLAEVQISIDGASKGTIKRIRRGVELGEIADGIKALYKAHDNAGKIRPHIIFNFISMMSNVYEMPLLIELARELEVPEVLIHPLSATHSNLEAEQPNRVAPGIEKYYYNIAKELADKYSIVLGHTDMYSMDITEYTPPIVDLWRP